MEVDGQPVYDIDSETGPVSYTVRMTDGQEYVWDGATTAYIGGMAFLCAPQGTRLNPAHVVAITPIDAQ